MYHLSMLRLGVNLQRLGDLDLKTVNELFLLTQPVHLQKLHGQELSEERRAEVRAEVLRKRLGGES